MNRINHEPDWEKNYFTDEIKRLLRHAVAAAAAVDFVRHLIYIAVYGYNRQDWDL